MLVNTHETCPKDYRRPNDGNTSANTTNDVTSSEIRQSLWLNPPAKTASNIDNSVWGYYADGFFDRRQISNSSTVSAATYDIAYIGNLFYDSNTGASLFFPAAGNRKYASDNTSGNLQFTGNNGYYWTSSSSGTSSYGLVINNNVASIPASLIRGFAMPIRCVKE